MISSKLISESNFSGSNGTRCTVLDYIHAPVCITGECEIMLFKRF